MRAFCSTLPGVSLAGVVDIDGDRQHQVADVGTTSCGEVARSPAPDLAVVAVPTESHARIALSFPIASGVHTLIEKPVTKTVAEADALIEAARTRGVVLAVGHSERFNPAVAAARR